MEPEIIPERCRGCIWKSRPRKQRKTQCELPENRLYDDYPPVGVVEVCKRPGKEQLVR